MPQRVLTKPSIG